MVTATDSAGRGRPPIGPRVTIALPAELLADIDAQAAARGLARAAEIRRRLAENDQAPRPNEGPGRENHYGDGPHDEPQDQR